MGSKTAEGYVCIKNVTDLLKIAEDHPGINTVRYYDSLAFGDLIQVYLWDSGNHRGHGGLCLTKDQFELFKKKAPNLHFVNYAHTGGIKCNL